MNGSRRCATRASEAMTDRCTHAASSSGTPRGTARLAPSLLRWIDSGAVTAPRHAAIGDGDGDRIDFARILPFVGMHLACLFAFVVGVSPVAVLVAAIAYLVRMFAITGFYHRYFSHRSFKTSRAGQFVFGVLGAAAVQRGFVPDLKRVRDLLQFPELRWLDRFDILVPLLLAVGMFGLGVLLQDVAPHLGTNGWQMLIWGFFISTVACYHGTYTINSLSHVFGRQRYRTGDSSRNNWLLALVTLGEGWHNNHHHYPSAVRQGFYWWEVDITFYLLKLLSWLGIIWDLKPVPVAARDRSPRRIHGP